MWKWLTGKSSPKCMVCGKAEKDMGTIQYTALDEHGEEALFSASICDRCGKQMDDISTGIEEDDI